MTDITHLPLPADAEIVIGSGSGDASTYVDPSRGMAEFKIIDIRLVPGRRFPGDPEDKEVLPQFELRWESCKEPGATIRQWITYSPRNYYGPLHNMTKLLSALFPDGIPHGFKVPSGLVGMHCTLLISQATDKQGKRKFKQDGVTPYLTIKAHEPLEDGHPFRGKRDASVNVPATLPPSNGARIVTPEQQSEDFAF